MSTDRRRSSIPSVLAVILAACVFAPLPAAACCTAGPVGSRIQIASQEILIVWDKDSGTEHFIRRASFATGLDSFGFLVPTPSVPSLGEARDDLFNRLGDAIKPEKVTRRNVYLGSYFLGDVFHSSYRSLEGGGVYTVGVRVLFEQRVAGYDAVVLDADDPKALATWLQDHGYNARKELVEWVRPYVEARWKITAFKLAPKKPGRQGDNADSTRYAVRMTFKTEKPLFPFRTPSDQHPTSGTTMDDGRGKLHWMHGHPEHAPPGTTEDDFHPGDLFPSLLRIFFVGDQKVSGSFGGKTWDAQIQYANRRDDLRALLAGALPAGTGPATGWLTTFEDSKWPRAAADDLYFAPAADATPIVPPPIVTIENKMIPVEPFGVGLIAFAGLVVFIRRRRRASPAAS